MTTTHVKVRGSAYYFSDDEMVRLVRDTEKRIANANAGIELTLGSSRKRGVFVTYPGGLPDDSAGVREVNDSLPATSVGLALQMRDAGVRVGGEREYEFGWKVTKRYAETNELLVRQCFGEQDPGPNASVWHKLSKTPLHFRLWVTQRHPDPLNQRDLAQAGPSTLRVVQRVFVALDKERLRQMRQRLEDIEGRTLPTMY